MDRKLSTSRCAVAVGVAAALLVGGSVTASAAPTGAKNSFTFPTSCTDGQTVEQVMIVVNSANGQGQGTNNNPKGQATFTPGHIVGTNKLLHPTAFNLTFTFTPAQGPSQSFTQTSARSHGPASPVTCTIDYTTPPDSQGNTFGLSGTVQGYIT